MRWHLLFGCLITLLGSDDITWSIRLDPFTSLAELMDMHKECEWDYLVFADKCSFINGSANPIHFRGHYWYHLVFRDRYNSKGGLPVCSSGWFVRA